MVDPDRGLVFHLEVEALRFLGLTIGRENVPEAIDLNLHEICECVADPTCLLYPFTAARARQAAFGNSFASSPSVFAKLLTRLCAVHSKFSPILKVLRYREITYWLDGRLVVRPVNKALNKEIVACVEDEFPEMKGKVKESAVARCRERLAEMDDPIRFSRAVDVEFKGRKDLQRSFVNATPSGKLLKVAKERHSGTAAVKRLGAKAK